MMTLARRLVLPLVCAGLLAGCAMGHAPVTALITLNEMGPVAAGPAMSQINSAATRRLTRNRASMR